MYLLLFKMLLFLINNCIMGMEVVKMKRIISIIMITTLCLSLIGCTKDEKGNSEKVNNKNVANVSEKKSSEKQDKDSNNVKTGDESTTEASSTATETLVDNPKTSDTTMQITEEQAIDILKSKDSQQLKVQVPVDDCDIMVTEDIVIKNISCYSLYLYSQTTGRLEGLFAISKDGELIFRYNGHKYVEIS